MASEVGALCVWLAAVLAAVSAASSTDLLPEDTAYEMITESRDDYPHPKLPYAYDALEPFLSEATMKVHHQGHHRAYCAKLNAALKEWREKVRPGAARAGQSTPFSAQQTKRGGARLV